MTGSQLMLHRGAQEITREALAAIEAPPPQKRWYPVAHFAVLQAVENTLRAAGFGIQTSRYGVSRDNHQFFGTLDLTTPVSTGVALSVGVRNSTNRTFPLGFCAGHRVTTMALDKSGYMLEHPRIPYAERYGVRTISRKDRREPESSETTRLTLFGAMI